MNTPRPPDHPGDLPPHRFDRPIPHDVAVNYAASGVAIVGAVDTDGAVGTKGGPLVIFYFDLGHAAGHQQLGVALTDENGAVRRCTEPEYRTLLGDMARTAVDLSPLYREAKDQEAKDAAVPGPVLCPGCGSKLYGDVAVRGGCLGCFPEVPPGEVRAS